MRLTTRFFEVTGQYRLIAFEAMEGGEIAFPEGSVLLHQEPIHGDGCIDGFDIWALVPSSRMAEVVNDLEAEDA